LNMVRVADQFTHRHLKGEKSREESGCGLQEGHGDRLVLIVDEDFMPGCCAYY
jgi:hypothetical protein